jgi:hypothetical protein
MMNNRIEGNWEPVVGDLNVCRGLSFPLLGCVSDSGYCSISRPYASLFSSFWAWHGDPKLLIRACACAITNTWPRTKVGAQSNHIGTPRYHRLFRVRELT